MKPAMPARKGRSLATALLMAGIATALLGGVANAGGPQDLEAARAASDKGVRDEAIRLYSRALDSGDLKPEQREQALRGRAEEYDAKALIADAFARTDEGKRLRDNAIADWTEALKIKSDPDVYAARGQSEHMNGQEDKALADFDEALKTKSTPQLLAQRGTAALWKGDVDGAVADFDKALAAAPKKGGVETVDLVNQRGYANFLGGRFDAAATDFAQAMSQGMAESAGDVLWLPYQTIWLHLARARAGKDDTQELKDNAGRIDLTQWPGTAIAYFLGQKTLEQVSSASGHGMGGRGRECGVAFFAGEQALAKGDKASAGEFLRRAAEVCNAHTIYKLIARSELKKLGG